mmetsp:Transcript_6310/g.9917  ORF Transcript_6310/g.9917 Transcript_6310/m.9917 type:complete len:508 (+) Transcript_6310:77-1600(+)
MMRHGDTVEHFGVVNFLREAERLLDICDRNPNCRRACSRRTVFVKHCLTIIYAQLEGSTDDKDIVEKASAQCLKTFEGELPDDIYPCIKELVDSLAAAKETYLCSLGNWADKFHFSEGREEDSLRINLGSDIPLTINLGFGGKALDLVVSSNDCLRDLKCKIRSLGGPKPSDQKITLDGTTVEDMPDAKLAELGFQKDSNVILICTPICPVCQETCKCPECHSEGRFNGGCTTCGKKRPDCRRCNGPCKCPECHGYAPGYTCSVCGNRDARPCWGGDTKVLQPNGRLKNVRDCRVGDEVCTLRGSRRIARIWTHDPERARKAGIQSDGSGVEVCNIDGIWITSHHPIINQGEWVYPNDLQASAPWQKRQHVVPDLFNFELEGHDDTILLWGGGNLMISCTIGKYMGPRFGYGVFTRRTTRCKHDCAQCDAVFDPDIDFANLPLGARWLRYPEFPQVDWDDGVSDFELANMVKEIFAPSLEGSTKSYEADIRCDQLDYCRNVEAIGVN